MTKSYTKEYFKEAGKRGVKKRWADRYEIIKKLSSYYDKTLQNQFIDWPTKILKELLKHAENKK